jgi:hypothetical protein
MRVLWCWRCRMDVPMVDDDEWEVLMRAHVASNDPLHALAILNEEARRRGLAPVPPVPDDAGLIARRLHHLLAGYALFTGVEETVPNAVWHHRASQYGPPCEHCGKPLRTPQARWCPACGGSRGSASG